MGFRRWHVKWISEFTGYMVGVPVVMYLAVGNLQFPLGCHQ